MFDPTTTLLWLNAFAACFALAGIAYSQRHRSDLEDYVVARNSQGRVATVLTLLASSLGAWILLAPAQAATWGGIAAVTGYALGAMSPRIAMIPLGPRMRTLIPEGHALTEFLIVRYGRPMYALTLAIMLFHLFIALSAEITAMARLVTLIAPVPQWVTAAIVMDATLLCTSVGGLLVAPFIFLTGLFGLAWVAQQPGGDASVALFAVLLPSAPEWFVIATIPLRPLADGMCSAHLDARLVAGLRKPAREQPPHIE